MVAKVFGKRHDNVLRDIETMECSKEFRLLNFEESSYKNEQGKKQPCVNMTRDGFTFLVMGYRGKKAAQFKETYIRRFNQMEKFIQTLVETRQEFPLLTENIKLLHENPKPYHFSNECDMLNRIPCTMRTGGTTRRRSGTSAARWSTSGRLSGHSEPWRGGRSREDKNAAQSGGQIPRHPDHGKPSEGAPLPL